MRLAMFSTGSGPRLGVVRPDDASALIDLSTAAGAIGGEAPADLLALIDQGAAGLDRIRGLLSSPPSASVRRLSEVELLAPLDPPRGNVLAIGRNYRKHAEEFAPTEGGEVKAPTIFTKAITSIAGPLADLAIDFGVSEQIDWEVELGVVLGRAGYGIRQADARGHVFGYTVVNDVSARDVQYGWGGQFFKGKSLDGSCPVGPFVVTADEVPDPQALTLRLLVNGVVKQEANTRDMIHSVDAIIEWLSRGMTLLPGMLVATGTPEGVGHARTPPEFLRPGDVMESQVEGIGTLRNRIVAR